MKNKHFKPKKSGKGKTFRPCHVCNMQVNFILWEEETERRKRRIFHWANEDGTHHIHFETVGMSEEQKHLNSIMNEG